MSRNRASPSLVGETDRHRRSGGLRGKAEEWTGGRAWAGVGPGQHLTLDWVGAGVQVGGGCLLCLLRGSGARQQESKVARVPAGLMLMGSPPKLTEPACWDLVPAQVWCTCSPIASCQMHLPGPRTPQVSQKAAG